MSKDKGEDGVARQRDEIEKIKRNQQEWAASTSVSDKETVDLLKKEVAELKSASEKRFGALEEEIAKERRLQDEAVADAEAWKNEALRPGKKQGNLAVEATPVTQARVRARTVQGATPDATRLRVDEHYKSVVKRHGMEVDVLQEMRMKEVKARREAEEDLKKIRAQKACDDLEIERLHERMKKLEMEKRQHGGATNLKSRRDR
ncbi:hypothetical protein CBR_g38117 [Chara braunii]|uniref:Uncharacterized protein n=1 Tax=Chara braunii TaxID=69332 RepID=A0A388LPK6_CHABU|nr:hypothetical protein CBR_g38117 [Chara braunii]|eukprot:GBG84143.1 hypothetical protein CBR_g38117 [Chara braunii]